MNSRNLSPKEAAEVDSIMKLKKNLYKFSGQLVHVPIVKEKGRNVPPNIPNVTMEHEANGSQRFIEQGPQSFSLNSIFHCWSHRLNAGLCRALV